MYYKFIPVWKDNSRKNWAYFIGDDSIVHTKFKSIKDGLIAAELDGTCLRENNWEILECTCFGLIQKRITLRTLYDEGYLSPIIDKDNISTTYNFL